MSATAQVTQQELMQLHYIAEMGMRKGCGLAGMDERFEQLRAGFSPRLQADSGAFVTLTRHGQLRGCIGYILPYKPLAEAVFENGYNAAARDPRFSPMTEQELNGLEIEVSVLSPPEPIAGLEEFELGRHGIILKKAGRSAVFLPEVATQQGWDKPETLTHLAQKAGLPPDAWSEGAEFEVFTSEIYQAPAGANWVAGSA